MENGIALTRQSRFPSIMVEEGYGTNRVDNALNEKEIKTKRGTALWRGTSIRAMIEVKRNYEIHIKFKVSAEQFLAQENKIA